MSYDPWQVHANRGLKGFMGKMIPTGACPQFIWNGQTWDIIPSSAKTNQKLTTGGIQVSFGLRFSTPTDQFYTDVITTPDQVRALMLQQGGTTMSYLGGQFVPGGTDNYKITDVEIAPNGHVLVIDANAINEDA